MNHKVAIVTGGSRGIGRSIALMLARSGWEIALTYRSNVRAAQQAADEISASGSTVQITQVDMANLEQVNHLVDTVMDRFGKINLLVNNAGIAPRKRVDMLKIQGASFDEVLGVNLKGPFFLTQWVAIAMIQQINNNQIINPKIINIGSISAYTSSTERAEYCISKAGLSMTTNLWADRLAAYGITVFEIRPGIIQTDMTSTVKAKYDQKIYEDGITPIRRWGQPEDVGKAVLAIAEEMFPFSTGEIINVDGGFHIARL